MKPNTRMILLGVYDSLLALGAIVAGVLMIGGIIEIFREYPKEWLGKVPFTSWVAPGIIAIAVFGLGNVLAAASCFQKAGGKPLTMSAVMGAVFFIGLVAQVLILGDWYIATIEFLLLSVIQLGLCGFAALGSRTRTGA